MDKETRKAAVSAYRERKPDAGVFAVHAGGGCWIGASPTLDKAENRLRFTLAQGTHPNKALQAAGGEPRVEVLERLDPETPALSRERLLKERLAHWLEKTGAARL